jgi:predicted enzyme related to lactoylglutathione lyase
MAQKPNSVVHVEIHSNAPEKTKAFLKDVFDWKFQDMPEMNYSMFEAPSAPGGGLQKAENLPAGIINYILSEDIDGTLKKIQSSGGAVVMPKAEIPGMGWFAVFQDPTGITLALYENAPQPRAARAKSRRTAKKTSTQSKGRKRGRRSR